MESKKILLALTLLITSLSFGQTNTFPSNGNVGIGTTNPTVKFDVHGDTRINGNFTVNGFTKGTINAVLTTGNNFYEQFFNLTQTDNTSGFINRDVLNWNEDGFANNGNLVFKDNRLFNNKTTNQPNGLFTTNNNMFAQNATGSIGFVSPIRSVTGGTGTGTINFLCMYDTYNGPVSNTFPISNFTGLNLTFTPQNNVTNAFGISIGELYGTATSRGIDLRVSSGANKFNIYAGGTANNYINGNLGIGTTTPDEKLTVKGKIHAQEVKVNLQGACAPDYVFQKYYTGKSNLKSDYVMPTLAEIESFTKKNHHLPNVPSAKEIQEKGVSLGEMSNVLLQKVEELTLYAIEQQKKLEVQNKTIEMQSKILEALTTKLNSLEKK